MGYRDMELDEIQALVGERHAVTGMEYPPQGLQPYYQWLISSLHQLAQASAGAFRVDRDADVLTSVYVAPGRATVDGVVLVHQGGSVALAIYNNALAYIWLENESGAAKIGVGESTEGWPVALHIKLAEVTLAGGVITGVLDRRFESMLRV